MPGALDHATSGVASKTIRGSNHPHATVALKSCNPALKLSFNSRFIDDRPYLHNLSSPKFIEDVLGEGDSLPVYREAKERALWRTVEVQPARYIGRIGRQKLNVEIKIGNFTKISLQHRAIT